MPFRSPARQPCMSLYFEALPATKGRSCSISFAIHSCCSMDPIFCLFNIGLFSLPKAILDEESQIRTRCTFTASSSGGFRTPITSLWLVWPWRYHHAMCLPHTSHPAVFCSDHWSITAAKRKRWGYKGQWLCSLLFTVAIDKKNRINRPWILENWSGRFWPSWQHMHHDPEVCCMVASNGWDFMKRLPWRLHEIQGSSCGSCSTFKPSLTSTLLAWRRSPTEGFIVNPREYEWLLLPFITFTLW